MDVSPEFFKVFMPNFSSKTMLLPPAFVRNNFPTTDEKIVMLKHESMGSSHIKMERKEDNKVYFTTGWERFAKKFSLELGDFMLFKLVANHIFEVKIYGKNGCKKNEVSINKSVCHMLNEVIKKEQNVGDQNRYFYKTITTSRSNRYGVFIPHMVHKGIIFEEDSVIRNRDDDTKLWPVTVTVKSCNRLGMCSGWSPFFNHYNLRPEDKCYFEVVVDQYNTCREIIVDVVRG